MTLFELYKWLSNDLSFGGCGDFEAKIIFEDILKISARRYDFQNIEATDEQIALAKKVIDRRKNGEPLQYITGEWDFYGLVFSVGKGVLIPRPETENLVDYVLNEIKDVTNPVVYDLCSGTGCIGLTIAKMRPDAECFLFEKEDDAFFYLEKNFRSQGVKNVTLVKCDIFDYDARSLPNADVLVSNPPYIKSAEISSLQREVTCEPLRALDGGEDGLIFYKCISQKWLSKVQDGGLVALECGNGQSNDVLQLFGRDLSEKKVIFDFNNIDRIVTFRI